MTALEDDTSAGEPTMCPSSQPDQGATSIFGIVGGTIDEPQIAYLSQLVPASPELLDIAGDARATQVFRLAGPCALSACQHFDGAKCRLAMRVVESLPTVVDALPPCRLRPNCRWFQQEGKAACYRCPGVVTESYNASELLHEVAGY
jgi:hypothetical protein